MLLLSIDELLTVEDFVLLIAFALDDFKLLASIEMLLPG